MERFGFIIHPLDVSDFERKFPAAARVPHRWLESVARFAPPLVASHITGLRSSDGTEAEGWFIGLSLTPRVMVDKMPLEKVISRTHPQTQGP